MGESARSLASSAPVLRWRQPAPPLRPFVHAYWQLDAPTLPGETQRYLPGAPVSWIFSLRPAGEVTFEGERSEQPAAALVGVLRGPCLASAAGPTRNIGVAFNAGAASCFHRIELATADQGLVDLQAIGDGQLRDLSRRLRSVGSFAEAARLIDAVLLERLEAGNPTRIGRDIMALVERGQVSDLDELAARTGYSQRQLRRIVRCEIGTSPKTLFRIARVRAATHALKSRDADLTSLAHELGYYDQAHFAHDFRSLVGMSPTAFRRERRALPELFESTPSEVDGRNLQAAMGSAQ